jgi:hypothetical protein
LYAASDYVYDLKWRAQQLQTAYEENGGTELSDEALDLFGLALHTATDATSPYHRGGQPWSGGFFGVVRHTLPELVHAQVVPGALNRGIGVARSLYIDFFGQSIYERRRKPKDYEVDITIQYSK